VIALYRTDRGRFALDERGEWQPSNKATIVTARDQRASVAYLCALLNSELLDLWYAVRGKHPRDVWRNYEPKPMARCPPACVGDEGEKLVLDPPRDANTATASAAESHSNDRRPGHHERHLSHIRTSRAPPVAYPDITSATCRMR